MSTEIIALAVGIIITWLIFAWVIKVLRASISTALIIMLILFVLQISLGITYQQIWQNLNQFVRQLLSQ